MNTKTQNNILFVAGGTGGHIFPALSVYNLFKNINSNLYFATDQRGIKFEEISKINPFLIKALGFERKTLLKKIASLVLLILSTFKAIFFIKKNKIKIVVGFGSYVQVPFVLAALVLKKNVILHEGNAVMGKANRLFWKYIKIRTSAFNLKKYFPDTIQIGMPLRNQVLQLNKNKYKPFSSKGLFTLLILGGSQGSNTLSYRLAKVIVKLPIKLRKKLIIFHQVRQEHLLKVKELYDSNHIQYKVVSFFQDLKNYLNKASLIISRAGSSSIHENITAGVPAIYIPIKNSVGNHQYENALFFKNNNTAWLLKEEDIDNGSFVKAISKIINQPDLLTKFALNNRRLRKPLAARKLKNLILSLEDKNV
jgi:UDP-N-acetylglucosamine--N-acetylmuramyl-(pentapeptide) pyrophosphoryl-undecaprenol N-acetylglucosamine transferase